MPAQKRKQPAINLLPLDDSDQNLVSRIISWVLSTFRFLVITVEIVVIGGFLSRFFLDSHNSDLTDEISQKSALIESYLPFERDFKLVQEKLSIFNQYAYEQPTFISYVESAASVLPSDLQSTKLTKNGQEITLVVVGSSEQSVVSFAEKLKQGAFPDISVKAVEGIEDSGRIQATLVSGSNLLIEDEQQ